MSSEHLEHPLLSGEPCQHSRLDGAEVADREGLSVRCHEGRSDELAERVRHVAVAEGHRIHVSISEQLPGEAEVADVVLREVLHLHQTSGPSACAGAVVLEESADPRVPADCLLHRLVFLVAGLGHLGADLKDAVHVLVLGASLDVGEVSLAERVELESCASSQPLAQLCRAVRIAQPCDLLCLHVQAGLVDGVHPHCVVHECHVHQYAPVVDALVQCVECLLVLSGLQPRQRLVELAFHLHVHAAVVLERLPALEVVGREHPLGASEQCGLMRQAELLDELLSFRHLLDLQAEGLGGFSQAEGESASRALRHGALPLQRVELLAEHPADAGALEGRVVRHLDHRRVGQCPEHRSRQGGALREVHDGHGSLVEGVGEQEDLEVRMLRVPVHSAVGQRLARVGLDVYVQSSCHCCYFVLGYWSPRAGSAALGLERAVTP